MPLRAPRIAKLEGCTALRLRLPVLESCALDPPTKWDLEVARGARRLREVFSSEWHSWIRGSGEKDADVMPKSSVGLFIETRFGLIYDATALEMALAFTPDDACTRFEAELLLRSLHYYRTLKAAYNLLDEDENAEFSAATFVSTKPRNERLAGLFAHISRTRQYCCGR